MAETKATTPEKTVISEYVTVHIPIYDRNEPPCIHVIINGKNYWVPRGKMLRLPKPVADIVKRKLRAERKTTQAIKQLDATNTQLY